MMMLQRHNILYENVQAMPSLGKFSIISRDVCIQDCLSMIEKNNPILQTRVWRICWRMVFFEWIFSIL